eukprot:TRINITY_DN390_c0_g2_i1.p1 TRINITY_DN390_c0_g2~~TRINITY_DN390_c0_g2_i1.p1  ORF type:complete len:513 (-),score=236.93 TRINITY_DN390_c0_g2_i1:133-1671(-)
MSTSFESAITAENPLKCKWSLQNKQPSPHHHVPYTPTKKYNTILDSVLDHIGSTPIVRLARLSKQENLEYELLAKCEFFNAGGSLKDRIGKRMIEDAELTGRIKLGDTLIEPTSGNTGIGLALTAAVKGYRMIITLPEKMSQEKVDVLKALGAEIIRTPTEAAWDSPQSHIGVALRLRNELPNAHILDQYSNPSNPLAHYDGTAEEIFHATEGRLDVCIVSAGTGGAITGISRRLKELIPNIKIVGVDPVGSILAQPDSLNGPISSYKVEGIGYDFIPRVLDRDCVDEWIKTEDHESFIMARRLIRTEGLLCGGSSGSVVSAAIRYCKNLKAGQRCLVILADSTRNYMSKFLSDDWMIANGFEDEIIASRRQEEIEKWKGATVADLKLVEPVTILNTATCVEAVQLLKSNSINQLPVINNCGKLLGLLTEGTLLSKITRGVVKSNDPVSKAMLIFSRKRPYTPITKESKLADLNKFFEQNSVAIVTENVNSEIKIKGIITPIDLLSFWNQSA